MFVVALLSLIAAKESKGRLSLYIYTSCTAVLCLVFIAVGGGMTVLGIGLKVSGSFVAEFFDNCESEMGDSAGCKQKKICLALRSTRNKLFLFLMGAGIPLLAAGFQVLHASAPNYRMCFRT